MLSDDLLARIAQEFYATVLDSDAKARMRGARITEKIRQGWIAHVERCCRKSSARPGAK
jgi:hypothetical protein